MQTYINSFQVIENQLRTFKVFGYSTKGMPGLEVVGFGKNNRLLKEKIIYFTKSCGIKVSNRRYVICLEDEDSRTLQVDQVSWFEIPTLILFWALADVIPLKNIHECFASGKIKADGSFYFHSITPQFQSLCLEKSGVLIAEDSDDFIKTISLSEIIKEGSEDKKYDQVV